MYESETTCKSNCRGLTSAATLLNVDGRSLQLPLRGPERVRGAPMTRTERERIAILEQQVRDMKDDVRETRRKVEAMHDLLMQAKGARWAIVAVAGLAGFLAGTAHKLLPLLGLGPR